MFRCFLIGVVLNLVFCQPAKGQDGDFEEVEVVEDLNDFFDDNEIELIKDRLSFLYDEDLTLQIDKNCEYDELTGEVTCRKVLLACMTKTMTYQNEERYPSQVILANYC